ncbi:MAG TPA: hypothetical protein VF068_13630 [Rubrobacter sp.]
MFYFASELLDYGRRDIGRQKVLLAGALVSGGLVCATLRRDAQARRGAPLLAPDGRRGLLSGLLRCRRVRGSLIPYPTDGDRSPRGRAAVASPLIITGVRSDRTPHREEGGSVPGCLEGI